MLVYLAGAMEHSPDRGAKWRKDISKFLLSELNHKVFNPCIEQSKILHPIEQANIRSWKSENLTQFRNAVRKIIKFELNLIVNGVDYIICLWDEFVLNGGGTQGELTLAHFHNIPVYMVSEIPTSQISSWILGCTTELFNDFEGLKKFLRKEFLK